MEIEDPVYGSHKLEENVLIELINSDPVQRLKGVHQAGPSPFFIEDKPYTTRYEHSIGVMMLLREFDASLEEQIAGLLHDVPHTAFSHVADFVFEEEGHEYHERFMEDIIYDSKIPEILQKHGYDIDYILEESNFKLLERDLPKLCADRLDYSMRDLKSHKKYNMEEFIESLTVKDDEFIFQDFESAEDFGLKFIELDSTVYASPKEVAIYEIFADIIRKALEIEAIDEEDLFTKDKELMEKLRDIDCDEIQLKFELLDSGLEVETNEEEYDIIGNTKARAVDPPFIENGEILNASDRSDKLKNAIKEHRQNINNGLKINIVSP